MDKVYLFFENRIGEQGKLIGVFSDPEKAIIYSKQEMADQLPSVWKIHHQTNKIWINQKKDCIETYFTIEESVVDRLFNVVVNQH